MPTRRKNEICRVTPVAAAGLPLTKAELEVVDLFSEFAKSLGMPASAGGIYGLLFAARIPLHMNQIKDALGISLGATSQGLKLLRAMGVVQMSYQAGDRRDHYVPLMDAQALLGALLRHKVYPNVTDASHRVARILKGAEKEGASGAILERIQLLVEWQKFVLELFSRWQPRSIAEQSASPHLEGNH
jgi:DNA-binding transcriptional regulator GbsR (MarR family)